MQDTSQLKNLLAQTIQATDHLSQSPYAIAVAALVPSTQQPACINWLLDNFVPARVPSASWQDQYVSQYAAALALYGSGRQALAESLLAKLPSVVRYFAVTETLTFGGLIGALDRYAEDCFGLHIDHAQQVKTVVVDEAHKWSRLIAWEGFLESSRSIAGYGGECVYGQPVDLEQFMDAFGAPNGSISNSPSASAMTVLSCRQAGVLPTRELLNYVEGLDPYQRTVGELDHVSHFNAAWCLMFVPELLPFARALIPTMSLQRAVSEANSAPLVCPIGLTTVPGELDTGAVTMIALNTSMAERQRLFERVEHMFDGSRYRTFLFERNASVTTNIHIAGAWPNNPHLDQMLGWLAQELNVPTERWGCKWHLSAYYVATEVARLLSPIRHPIARQLAARALDFFMVTQQPDGGWGRDRSTVEETAYAVLGLLAGGQQGLLHDWRISAQLERARRYLMETPPGYEKLWIGKSLYCVRPLVRALQYAALSRLEAVGVVIA